MPLIKIENLSYMYVIVQFIEKIFCIRKISLKGYISIENVFYHVFNQFHFSLSVQIVGKTQKRFQINKIPISFNSNIIQK